MLKVKVIDDIMKKLLTLAAFMKVLEDNMMSGEEKEAGRKRLKRKTFTGFKVNKYLYVRSKYAMYY
jgi:hypothetical protein